MLFERKIVFLHPVFDDVTMTELVIFDFDGTLGDTRQKIVDMLQRVMRERGLPVAPDDACAATIGIPLTGAFLRLFPDMTEAEAEECTETYRVLFERHRKELIPELFPHVRETLEQLKNSGIRMSIASSRTSASLWAFLDDMGLKGYFEYVIGAQDCAEHKPSALPVLATLERLNVRRERAVVVGDMPVDILMGCNAGCRTVAVTYGNGNRADLIEAGADYVIDDIRELLQHL